MAKGSGTVENIKGFTLLEVIVSLALIGITFAALMELFSSTLRTSRRTIDYTQAIIIASSEMERSLSGKLEAGTETERIDIYNINRDVKVLDTESEDLKVYEVTIAVSWDNNSYTLKSQKVQKQTDEDEQ